MFPAREIPCLIVLLLGISLFLQFIAIVTPGWYILTFGNATEYDSLFYGTLCRNESFCETKSYHEWHIRRKKVLHTQYIPVVEKDYNLDVKSQVEAVCAFLIPAVVFVVEFLKVQKRIRLPVLIYDLSVYVIGILLLAVTLTLLVENIGYTWIRIVFFQDQAEPSPQNDVGFSWSVLLYAFSAVLTGAAFFLMCYKLFGSLNRLRNIQFESNGQQAPSTEDNQMSTTSSYKPM